MMTKMKAVVSGIRLGRIQMDLVCAVFAAVVLGVALSKSFAETSSPDGSAPPYVCACSDVTLKITDIYGGIECQHGPLNDLDCWLMMIGAGQIPPTVGEMEAVMMGYCEDGGGAPPNNIPTLDQLPQALRDYLIALGFNANDSDGKCECYTCVTQIKPNLPGMNKTPCEMYAEYFGAHCEKVPDALRLLNAAEPGKVRELLASLGVPVEESDISFDSLQDEFLPAIVAGRPGGNGKFAMIGAIDREQGSVFVVSDRAGHLSLRAPCRSDRRGLRTCPTHNAPNQLLACYPRC